MILEREEGEEREKHQCEKHQLVASHMHPDWGQTHNLGTCPDQGLNLQSFGVQDDAPTNGATLAMAVLRILSPY